MPVDPYLISFIALGIVGLFSGGIGWRELRWVTEGRDPKYGTVTKKRRNFGDPQYADFIDGKRTGEVRSSPIAGIRK